MKILRSYYGNASMGFDVVLSEEERALPDYALINLADAGGDATKAAHVRNFGGSVDRHPRHDGSIRVDVYTD